MDSYQNMAQPQILSQDEIDFKAWKYTGYRGFADFMSSDVDFFAVRRFDKLNTRVLLTLQDNLSALEEQLENMDKKYSAKNFPDIDNGTCRGDQADRAQLIGQISAKLQQYSRVLKDYSDLRTLPKAADTNVTNLKNWFHNNQGAITTLEQEFINHREDLISITTAEKATIRRFFESHILFRLSWIWKKDAPDIADVDKSSRKYISDDRIDTYTTIVVFVVGLFMLIAPLWILAVVKDPHRKLGVITAFVVAFLGTLSYATVAKPFETLAATAAYSAVLMVFLQLGNS